MRLRAVGENGRDLFFRESKIEFPINPGGGSERPAIGALNDVSSLVKGYDGVEAAVGSTSTGVALLRRLPAPD